MPTRSFVPAAALSSAVAAVTILGSASPAFAQRTGARGFGDKHQLIFGVDRVMPFFSYSATTTSLKRPGPGGTVIEQETTAKRTTSAVLWNGQHDVIYNIPRVAVDFTVIEGLTVGGSAFAFFTLGSTNEVAPTSTDGAKVTVFGFAPRAGYILPLGEVFAFWPRGGFSYVSSKTSTPATVARVLGTNSTTDSAFATHVEAMFAVVPLQHVAILFGPGVDIPIAGSHTVTAEAPGVATTSSDGTFKQFQLGITAGLVGYL